MDPYATPPNELAAHDLHQAPAVSVVIPFYGQNIDELTRCVQAIERQSTPPAHRELFIVDNNRHPVVEMACKISNATIIHQPKPGSFAARNAGAKFARAKILAFTDADCIPDKDWLAKGIEAMQAATDLEVIGGAIEVRPRVPDTPTLAEELDQLIHLRQSYYVESLEFAATANFIVGTKAFFRIGGFDDDYLSCGDEDFCFRLRQLGGRISFAGRALVVHPARNSLSSLVKKNMRIVGGHNVRLSKRGKGDITELLRFQMSNFWRRQKMVWVGTKTAHPPRRLSLLLMLYVIYAARALEAFRLRVGRGPKRQ